ncbi:MAG: RNA pyrophosphohydrolase [Alphaproteobacteria bacterium]|nr:RNA pyrophosphohydrolase [Alphaproteobacteria bacterium]
MRKVDPESLPYRPCVGCMVLNREGLIFLGRRVMQEAGEAWQMPQGGIDAGEDPRAAALRELEEETGITKAKIVAEAPEWLTYDLPRDLIGTALKGKYRGQRQKWFALRFAGGDKDIDLNAHKHVEFDAYRWVEIDELPRLIVPFKRQVYQSVVDIFRPLAKPA